jgi:hypothetical protein
MPCEELKNDKGETVAFVCTAPWGMGTTFYPDMAGTEFEEIYGFGGSGDPHDFSPSFEENSPEEIAAWEQAKAECKCGRN